MNLEVKEIDVEHLEKGSGTEKGKKRMGQLKVALQVLKDGAHRGTLSPGQRRPASFATTRKAGKCPWP